MARRGNMDVVFQSHPDVELGTNTFRNVPIILQVEDRPLIEVGKFVPAGYTTKFHIYNKDGEDVAVAVGSQLYPSRNTKGAKVGFRHEPNLTVLMLKGKPIVEMRRKEAAALKTEAELFAPDGFLVKLNDSGIKPFFFEKDKPLVLAPWFIIGNQIILGRIGVHIRKDGWTLGAP